MQIVIDIPEDVYEEIKSNDWDNLAVEGFCAAVKNGTLLPKGHGRLIDADAMLEDVKNYCIDPDAHDWTIFDFINNADTIIEADREVNE